MRVGVVGTGYVGSVTAASLAEMGNQVTGIDRDEGKVALLQSGVAPIYEENLNALLTNNLAANRLQFTSRLPAAVLDTEVIFLALPTPQSRDGSADLSYVLNAAEDIGPLLNRYTVVVNKSTVPLGSARLVTERLARHAQVDFDVVSNPEFLREGHAVYDFSHPDRIVIGADSARARSVMHELYEPFVLNKHPIIDTDPESAELGKYAANAFLATKISFVNFIGRICAAAGADVEDVATIMGTDERIGSRFLNAGLGWGGSCFPKDSSALRHIAQEFGVDARLLDAVIDINKNQREHYVDNIVNFYEGRVAGKVFALWGLAFKEDTDDIREAPSLDIINALTAKGAKVIAYDPQAADNTRRFLGQNNLLEFADDQYEALDGADALLIATLWEPFRSPDFNQMKRRLRAPIIFDGRNVYKDRERISRRGFYYDSIGRYPVDGR